MDQGKGRFALQSRSAVIVISNDPTRTGRQRPLALALVMGTPLLRWLTHALAGRGVERWLLVCQKSFLSEARLCFPEGCELTACEDREAGNPLHVFLSSAREDEAEILVITGACVLLPGEGDEMRAPCACQVRCDELMTALDEEDFSFSRFLLTRGSACAQLDGIQAVNDPAELDGLSDRIRSASLRNLREQGVQIWDEASCHVDPSAVIGAGTVLMPGTVIGGDCVIGPDALLENAQLGGGCRINASQLSDCRLGSDCAVGPYVCIRSGSRLDSRVRVGSGTELGGVELGEATRVGALCALRELTCGRGCIIGSGVTCADGPVRMEEEAQIGGGATIACPVTIGRGASVSAGTVLTRDVPPQALVAAKARQSVRRDRTK